jgi:hypothetical protein
MAMHAEPFNRTCAIFASVLRLINALAFAALVARLEPLNGER